MCVVWAGVGMWAWGGEICGHQGSVDAESAVVLPAGGVDLPISSHFETQHQGKFAWEGVARLICPGATPSKPYLPGRYRLIPADGGRRLRPCALALTQFASSSQPVDLAGAHKCWAAWTALHPHHTMAPGGAARGSGSPPHALFLAVALCACLGSAAGAAGGLQGGWVSVGDVDSLLQPHPCSASNNIAGGAAASQKPCGTPLGRAT